MIRQHIALDIASTCPRFNSNTNRSRLIAYRAPDVISIIQSGCYNSAVAADIRYSRRAEIHRHVELDRTPTKHRGCKYHRLSFTCSTHAILEKHDLIRLICCLVSIKTFPWPPPATVNKLHLSWKSSNLMRHQPSMKAIHHRVLLCFM